MDWTWSRPLALRKQAPYSILQALMAAVVTASLRETDTSMAPNITEEEYVGFEVTATLLNALSQTCRWFAALGPAVPRLLRSR